MPARALLVTIAFGLEMVAAGCSPDDREPEARETAAARSRPAPESVGGIVAAWTDVADVVADLVSAERSEGQLTVAIRFRNVAEEPRTIDVPADYGRWRLEAGGRQWPLAREPDGGLAATDPPSRTLEPSQSALWRGRFVAPPPSVETFDLEVPTVRPFRDVPIEDRE